MEFMYFSSIFAKHLFAITASLPNSKLVAGHVRSPRDILSNSMSRSPVA